MPAATAIIEITGVIKQYGGLRPLRIARLSVGPTDRMAIVGTDGASAETLLNLVTGASLPDEGTVTVAGHDTRAIATDTEWLTSLDRFGIVTHRAVLIEALPIAANLALPLTLSIDPMPDDIRRRVESLADEVRIPVARIMAAAATLTPIERLRVHLARALALAPVVLLLEHPTMHLQDEGERSGFGATVRAICEARALAMVALTQDVVFADAANAARLTLNPATGALSGASLWQRWRKG